MAALEMTDITCIRLANGAFMPADAGSVEAAKRFKVGRAVRFKATQQRNYDHHKKWFALAAFAYDHWEPTALLDPKYPNVVPEKSFDRFRKDLIILSGFYEATFRVDGTTRIEAKSISFGSMPQDEFDQLYSNTIDAVLKHILTHYDRQELERVVMELMSFD